jgi:hypothetical protein
MSTGWSLVIHETEEQAKAHQALVPLDAHTYRPVQCHVSLGAVITGGPYDGAIWTHGAVMAVLELPALIAWAECTVASRVKL